MDTFKEIFGHPVDVVVYHKHAHSDELLAGWMLKEFGKSVFPGIPKARIEFWEAMPTGKTWRDLFFNEKTLVVGMGFSPYDEHLPDGTRVQDECSATLVASSLDLREDGALKGLLDFTLNRDRELGKNVYELPALVKTMWKAGVGDRDVVEIMSKIYRAIWTEGLQFAETAATDFKRAEILNIPIKGGRTVKFAAAISNSESFGKYARSQHGHYCSIALWRNSSGAITLQTNAKMNIDLTSVVQMLRYAELKAAGKQTPSWEHLASPGMISECPSLFFFKKGAMIMSTRGEKPIDLPWSEIKKIIRNTLHPDWAAKVGHLLQHQPSSPASSAGVAQAMSTN